MTNSEALDLFEDLQQLKSLRENRVWKNHVLPEIARMRAEARTGMRDRTLPSAVRCEHVAEHELAETLIEFLDKEEARMRASLNEHDRSSAIIERPFS